MKIVYASTTGTAKYYAEMLHDELSSLCDVSLITANELDLVLTIIKSLHIKGRIGFDFIFYFINL